MLLEAQRSMAQNCYGTGMMFISRVSKTGQKGLLYSDLETGLLMGFGCERSPDNGMQASQSVKHPTVLHGKIILMGVWGMFTILQVSSGMRPYSA